MLGQSVQIEIQAVRKGFAAETRRDLVAVEEPLEIRLGFQAPERWTTRSLSITMRTPGHDEELAVGFLVSEGIVRQGGDVAAVCLPDTAKGNVARVDLAPGVVFDPTRLDRHFYTTSSCGVCGKSSLDALSTRGLEPVARGAGRFPMAALQSLPALLRRSQPTFAETGGLHAAALFNDRAELLVLREDVGRHNAVDKVIGNRLLAGALPAGDAVLLVSGRASFELVQKTVAAGIPVLAAVGAPSSLAVELAREFEITLIGFLNHERGNIYSGDWRIRYETEAEE